MKYSFNCPAGDKVLTVDAKNDDEAMKKLMEAGKMHMKEAHADMPAMSDEKMKKTMRSEMKKEKNEEGW